MLQMNAKHLFGGLFILALCLAAGNIAISQVPTVQTKHKYKVAREFVVTVNGGGMTQVSHADWTGGLVPEGRTFVLTDVIINNLDTTPGFNMKVVRNDDGVNAVSFTVPPESTLTHAFVTGMEFPAGSKLDVRNGGTGIATFSLLGYERKQ